MHHAQQTYILSFAQLLCLAAIVFFDRRRPTDDENDTPLTSPKFLTAFMSIAAGVLTYSSLYTLLPAAQARLQFNPLPLFFGGVLLNFLLSRLVHAVTPKQFTKDSGEGSYQSLNDRRRQTDVENYGATEALRQPHDQPQAENVTASGYLQIGIQTTVAMCLHKLPEGIITFVSSSDTSNVGVTVFCAISLHNFTDGLMIALPLYAATRSAWTAFSYGACMGGVSQILGGVIGVIAISNLNQKYEDIFIGVVFAIVSGMMSLIAIQVWSFIILFIQKFDIERSRASVCLILLNVYLLQLVSKQGLLLQAFRLDQGRQSLIPFYFFVGILIVGLTSMLGSH
ncbi:hypothetical protein INT44_000643 [Umbelopsis vinacea]|uniref:Uncharacterized protein n=1 Tax=Umbelopsis vinacea TaxID=44442 RepID=A0A8H7Q8P2_9FUNG|nr:hypothetical protein INT44_000643 [Umbelopsis vinacea]